MDGFHQALISIEIRIRSVTTRRSTDPTAAAGVVMRIQILPGLLSAARPMYILSIYILEIPA
jgi:hypothetical protein